MESWQVVTLVCVALLIALIAYLFYAARRA